MATSWLFAAGMLALGRSTGDPASVKDPPGKVSVDQPAGVSFADRNTARDTTDTLRGGGTGTEPRP